VKRRFFLSVGFVLGFSLLVSGCATTGEYAPTSPSLAGKKGVYHKVRKGETLWRLAQAYRVNIDQIITANNIPNGAHLEEGQLILIPGAAGPVDVTTLPAEDLNKDDFVWPLRGNLLRYFGERRGGLLSKGVVIEAPEGQIVRAARQGKVVFADYLAGYAYTVILDHSDGYFTVYGYNSKLLVRLGDPVSKGDQIAEVGKVDRSPSLYFEIRRDGQANNPLYYLPKS